MLNPSVQTHCALDPATASPVVHASGALVRNSVVLVHNLQQRNPMEPDLQIGEDLHTLTNDKLDIELIRLEKCQRILQLRANIREMEPEPTIPNPVIPILPMQQENISFICPIVQPCAPDPVNPPNDPAPEEIPTNSSPTDFPIMLKTKKWMYNYRDWRNVVKNSNSLTTFAIWKHLLQLLYRHDM